MLTKRFEQINVRRDHISKEPDAHESLNHATDSSRYHVRDRGSYFDAEHTRDTDEKSKKTL